MEQLNYHHLAYFRAVAHEGGLLPAARKLRVTHSTVAAQVRALESWLGERLLVRAGRRLVPSDVGRVVLRYADEIDSLGRELAQVVRGHATGRPLRLLVGVADVLPKLMVRRLLAPAQRLQPAVRLVVHEDRLERLLADVATHALDVVLADAMPPPTAGVRVFGHLLAESNVGIFAAPALASRLRSDFPRSLHGAPMLLPTEGTTLRRSLDRFLRTARVEPEVVAEIEDGALLKAFGEDGSGVFPAPLSLAKEIARQYGAKLVGEARGVVEQFYAITAERRFEHPALLAITESARAAMEARRTERPPRRRARS